jgi:hypothetical protein
MSRREFDTDPDISSGEGWLARWSRRKREAGRGEIEDAPAPAAPSGETGDGATEPPGDLDMPPLESLDEDSDYSGFMSPKVSDALRKQALRKLFATGVFNVRDGLDDYDDDFTSFAKLGDVITAEMRRQLEHLKDEAGAGEPALAGADTVPVPPVEDRDRVVRRDEDAVRAQAPAPARDEGSRPNTESDDGDVDNDRAEKPKGA